MRPGVLPNAYVAQASTIHSRMNTSLSHGSASFLALMFMSGAPDLEPGRRDTKASCARASPQIEEADPSRVILGPSSGPESPSAGPSSGDSVAGARLEA